MIRTDKLIITVCPCGSFMTKEHNPNMPVQPDEIADEVFRAWNEGAAVAHIHARDKEGKATCDPDVFREIGRRIRDKGCDIVLEYSTSPGRRIGSDIENGFRALEAGPEMASLDIGVAVFVQKEFQIDAWRWTRTFVERLATAMRERGIKPEPEIYSSGGFLELDYLIQKGLLPKPYWVGFALDMQRSFENVTPYSPKTLMYYADILPQEALFTTLGIAGAQTPAVTQSILLGGHARVGFEDNVMYSRGVLAKSNAELVTRVARIGTDLGRAIATPSEARELLGLHPLG